MTHDRVQFVVGLYTKALAAHPAERFSGCKLCHVSWMLGEIGGWDASRLEKAFRWLGFIQGVLWCEGVYEIDEMKDHSRP